MNGPHIDRIVDLSADDEALVITNMLLTLPRPLDRVSAIAVYPGLGEDWRVADATRAYDANSQASKLLVAGVLNLSETAAHAPEDLAKPPFNLTRTDGIHMQVQTPNTPGQSIWLVDEFKRSQVESCALFVSPYHIVRALCTLIKEMQKRGELTAVIPVPVNIAPEIAIPDTGQSAWEMMSGEIKRLRVYQDKGDVATLDEVREYLNWLWQQPVLQSAELPK